MGDQPEAPAIAARGSGRWPIFAWFASSATLGVPQAGGPIAFALVALSLTGETGGGAAMILAMTIAQVVGAIPITRLGRRFAPSAFLRLLIIARTAALGAVVIVAANGAPFAWLIPLAAIAGSVNGAAYGYLRSILNDLVDASKLPRSVGVAATLNELTFVLAPVAASALGVISPILAVAALAIVGAVPALLVPKAASRPVNEPPRGSQRIITGPILLWLACATAGSSAVAAIEIGAVALALRFGYQPGWAVLFTVSLCVASVAGGVWVSVRNRLSSRKAVLLLLSTMSLGIVLAALNLDVMFTVTGAVLMGLVLAPLGTHYALVLDTLAPPGRRPEVFALLRTANAIGVILASSILTVTSISTTLVVVATLMVLITVLVSASSLKR